MIEHFAVNVPSTHSPPGLKGAVEQGSVSESLGLNVTVCRMHPPLLPYKLFERNDVSDLHTCGPLSYVLLLRCNACSPGRALTSLLLSFLFVSTLLAVVGRVLFFPLGNTGEL